ncbi:MAG: hypothetical protein ACTSYX_12045 [Candidatus Thorarchaeota archaeon]
MSKKRKSRKKPQLPEEQDLDTFEFRPTGLNLKWTKDLITVFDGYRIHRCYDLTFIERAIGEGQMPRSFVDQWRFIRTILHRFAAVSPKIPGVTEKYKRRQIVRFVTLVLLTIAVPLMVATFVFSITAIAPFTLALTALAIGAFMVQWLMGHYYNREIAWAIERYWQENPHLLKREKEALKKWVQRLIVHARFRIKKENELPEKNPIKFFNNDYEGIIVKAEPNWYRKHYVVQIKM